MDKTLLKNVGLTDLEIEIYLAVLELGSSLAGKISRKSGVHRRSVYDALERLIEKGLITYIIVNNRREYQAVSPNRLVDLLKEKQSNIEMIMPELMLKFNMSKENQTTLFYKGVEGIKSIFDDQLNCKEAVYVISGSKNVYEILPYYIKSYDRERVKKKIKVNILFNTGKNNIQKPVLADVRYLPDTHAGLASVNIYGLNVAIILWSKENPFGILIRHSEIAKSYMDYFNWLWAIAEK